MVETKKNMEIATVFITKKVKVILDVEIDKIEIILGYDLS